MLAISFVETVFVFEVRHIDGGSGLLYGDGIKHRT